MYSVAIVALWCWASAPLEEFNPHILNAAQTFVQKHPEACGYDSPIAVETSPGETITLETCRRMSFLRFQPGWLKEPRNKDKVYMGAVCMSDSLDLQQAFKGKLQP